MVHAELSDEEREELFEAMGNYAARLHAITNDRFGFVSRILTENQVLTWSECLIREVRELLGSFTRGRQFTMEEAGQILAVFINNKKLLDEVRTPHLLHTDLWEGNVILSLEQQKPYIKSVIDGDRAVFGDTDFEWAAPWMNITGILRGAGIREKEFSEPRRERRRRIYRVFYALMNCYVGAFEYNDRELYQNGKKEALLLVRQFAGAISE